MIHTKQLLSYNDARNLKLTISHTHMFVDICVIQR